MFESTLGGVVRVQMGSLRNHLLYKTFPGGDDGHIYRGHTSLVMTNMFLFKLLCVILVLLLLPLDKAKSNKCHFTLMLTPC